MSAISDFAGAVSASFDKVNTAVSDIQTDVDGLKAKIEALQNSSGSITAGDQALLDDIQARAGALADKVSALDELTPPDAPAEA